ncbi:MAG TPA: transketolase [Patescibacteria group bacterium]|nr:transketolase [Patescibacteria group bacterium]
MTLTAAELTLAAARARRLMLRMMEAGRSGHLGGALSAVDIITALYLNELDIDPANPRAPGRDRFVLSAGHKAMAQYAVLALAGFIPAEILDTYGSFRSPIPGHPDMHKLPGIEANTGALGHGLAIACGMALGARLDGRSSRVFVVLGDGELPEGSNWEGAAIAAHHRLDNIVVFVDANGLQISGRTCDVLDMAPIGPKFQAFGWEVDEIDGNDMTQIVDVLARLPLAPGKPSAIVAHTVKASGVSSIEGKVESHYWKPTHDELATAIRETEATIARLQAAAVR